MIEMAIIAMIVSSVTLRVAGNVAVDGLFAARGKESPRYTRAKARRTPGAATRYWSEVWDDTWTGWSAKRAARKAGQPSTPRTRGAATSFWAGWWQDRKRASRRRWDEGWTVLDEKRREKATRPRPGQQTVPGTVVPNAQDEDRPQDRPGPESRVVPDEDGRTDLRFGDDPTDPTGTKECPECHGTVLVDGEICPSCRDRQKQRSQHWDEQDEPESVPDYVPDFGPDQDIDPSPATPPTEGPTMTATAVDGTGLDPQIKFCEESEQQYLANARSNDNDLAISKQFADAYRQQVAVTDAALGAVPQGVAVTAVAAMHAAMDKATAAAADMEQIAALYTQAMDKANSAAADMSTAVKEFVSYKNLQEGYAAQPDAPDKEFLLAGR